MTASLTGYDTQTQAVTVGGVSVSVTFAFVTTTVNQKYTTAGIYTYTVPSNVPSINVTVIGGGGGQEAVLGVRGMEAVVVMLLLIQSLYLRAKPSWLLWALAEAEPRLYTHIL